ncbi:U-box domain-containing protein 4 isoform X4 [Alnus glutinosa]|nr:U-box domain-containing protein 4 isoform X4 [Alnus glutinosa]XP_062156688.1 U-box domain-containing protein 4 isoform X4 [Alnus glutinosa]XP_062156689.1 U-box domain-containing protein 4 isoform X4 [Alnus glutinosa]XP_062156690.1 U-box domain-containing protein 4 isoform X4 [Alnus glutinosa]
MEISLLKALLNNISSFFHLSSCDNINSEPVLKYYQKAEEILKLLKPILDVIVDSEIASDEVLIKAFEELSHSVEELRELFENWQSLSSKLYFVRRSESFISKTRTSGLDIFQLLKASHEQLPDELSSASLEHCVQKIKPKGYEQMSSIIKEAIRDQMEGVGPSSEILVKIAESLSLRSNQEILIEAVALEKLKENAEQAEKTGEAEYIDKMITFVNCMHDRLTTTKQSQNCSPVQIPPDFCCPLSLELMTDPVIVSSGQTYERAFIKKWIDLGLTVCPKTRQTLAHTNLITNYTVKALIANWCESNNVKLPDPMRSTSLNQPLPLLGHPEPGATRESAVFPHSRGNQPISLESSRSMGSPGTNLNSSAGIRREGTSPLHPRSSSEGSMTAVADNGQDLDIARISLTSSEDRSANSEERSMDSVGQPTASPSGNEFSSAIGDEESSQSHNRTASASSVLSGTNFSQRTPGDADEASHISANMTGYSSDVSGEVRAEPHAAALTSPQREPEFSPRLLETRSRSQTIWRRPSERYVPRLVSSPVIETRADLSGLETIVRKVVDDLKSTSLDTQRDATAELRLLAKHNMDNRIVIANCGAIGVLVNLLCSTDTRIQENAVTALLNLSINDNNKTAIANADAIVPLIHVLQTGSPEARENSAATLFSLSVIEDNKIRIGRSGAIGPLVDLLGNGTPRGKKDAATALFNLSIFHENKARIVQAGAVKHLVELMDPAAGMVDKAVAVLANLATIPEGRVAIGQEGGIPVLVEVVELGSARGRENAAAALLHLCTNSSRFCTMVLQEGAVPPLVALSQSGTPRAKEKAQALLSYFRTHRHGNAGRG